MPRGSMNAISWPPPVSKKMWRMRPPSSNSARLGQVNRRIAEFEEGGRIRHIFFDTGGGQLVAFMEPRGIPGLPVEYDAGINRGLGVPDAFYHFAFQVESREALEAKRAELIAKGVKVTPIVDHEWMQSIYLKDPNGIMLEFAWGPRARAGRCRDAGRERLRLRARSPVTDFRST